MDVLFLVPWMSCCSPMDIPFLSHGCLFPVPLMSCSCPWDVLLQSLGCFVPVPRMFCSCPKDVFSCPIDNLFLSNRYPHRIRRYPRLIQNRDKYILGSQKKGRGERRPELLVQSREVEEVTGKLFLKLFSDSQPLTHASSCRIAISFQAHMPF